MMSEITTDARGFVYIDGVKICQRLISLGKDGDPVLRFYDKCRRRASQRGTPFVDVGASELAEAVKKTGGEHD